MCGAVGLVLVVSDERLRDSALRGGLFSLNSMRLSAEMADLRKSQSLTVSPQVVLLVL